MNEIDYKKLHESQLEFINKIKQWLDVFIEVEDLSINGSFFQIENLTSLRSFVLYINDLLRSGKYNTTSMGVPILNEIRKKKVISIYKNNKIYKEYKL